MKAFTAPFISFTKKFNAFCRPVAAPQLSFLNVCEATQSAFIVLDWIPFGRVMQNGPDSVTFMSEGEVNGTLTMEQAKGVFRRLVLDEVTVSAAVQAELTEVWP